MLYCMVQVALGKVMEMLSKKHWEMSNTGSTHIENNLTSWSHILENVMELILEHNLKYSG